MKRTIAIILVIVTLYLLFAVAGMDAEAAYDEQENVSPYSYLILLPDEIEHICECVYTECGSLSYCGNGDEEVGRKCYIATFQVVLNRYMSEIFMDGHTRVEQIIFSPTQFACYPYFLNSNPPDWVYEILYDTLLGIDLQLPYYVCFYSLGVNAGTTYFTKIGKHVFAYREIDKTAYRENCI